MRGWCSFLWVGVFTFKFVEDEEEFPGELLTVLEMEWEWLRLLVVDTDPEERTIPSTPEDFLSDGPITRKSAWVITRIKRIPNPNIQPARTKEAPVYMDLIST